MSDESDFDILIKRTALSFWPKDETENGIFQILSEIFDYVAELKGHISSTQDPKFQELIRVFASRLQDYRTENGGTSTQESWLLIYGLTGYLAGSTGSDGEKHNFVEMLNNILPEIYPQMTDNEITELLKKALGAIIKLLNNKFSPSPLSGNEKAIPLELITFQESIRDISDVSSKEAEIIYSAFNLLIGNLK